MLYGPLSRQPRPSARQSPARSAPRNVNVLPAPLLNSPTSTATDSCGSPQRRDTRTRSDNGAAEFPCVRISNSANDDASAQCTSSTISDNGMRRGRCDDAGYRVEQTKALILTSRSGLAPHHADRFVRRSRGPTRRPFHCPDQPASATRLGVRISILRRICTHGQYGGAPGLFVASTPQHQRALILG